MGGTLFYSPGVEVIIDSAQYGIIDVSDDITEGELRLQENNSHNLNLSLANPRRKYDQAFAPNDRVVVRLKRIQWLQVFAGYLTMVPMYSVWPRTIRVTAECTRKRLRHFLYDANSTATWQLIESLAIGDGATADDLANTARELLVQVVQWPADAIHIGSIPERWQEAIQELYDAVSPSFVYPEWGNSGQPVISGIGGYGTSSVDPGTATIGSETITIPGTGVLPTSRGRALRASSAGSQAPLVTGSAYTVSMRWPYQVIENESLKTPPPGMTEEEAQYCQEWWNNQKLIVHNGSNGKRVVVQPFGWGPGVGLENDYDLTLDDGSFDYLEIEEGDKVQVLFDNKGLELGPLVLPDQVGYGVVQHPADAQVEDFESSTLTDDPNQEQSARTDVALQKINFDFTDRVDPEPQSGGQGMILKGHVHAARAWIRANWPSVSGTSGTRGQGAVTGNPSRHSQGLALDISVPGEQNSLGEVSGDARATLNSVAQWFAANPQVFNVANIIWFRQQNGGSGWTPYSPSSRTTPGGVDHEHVNHVHIGFNADNPGTIGPVGGAWPGSALETFTDPNEVFEGTGLAGSITGNQPGAANTSGGQGGNGLYNFNLYNWAQQGDPISKALIGHKLLMNDTPILDRVASYIQASVRSYCMAPNGDFIAWWPDYFGHYGQAGVLEIEDIELKDFTVHWTDENLKTHFFVVGSNLGSPDPTGGAGLAVEQADTHGVATVEMDHILEALLGFDVEQSEIWNRQAILERFGPRVHFDNNPALRAPIAEFWAAIYNFMENWSTQFRCSAPITFMPEAWPGMLLRLKSQGIQFYITSVTHRWSMRDGFSTQVAIKAPSKTDESGLIGLPQGGPLRGLPDQDDPVPNNPLSGFQDAGPQAPVAPITQGQPGFVG